MAIPTSTMDHPTDADADASDPEVMKTFYNRLFPWKQLFTWLNHEHVPSRMFTHREFAFTLAGDIYLRYNSFANHEEMKKEVMRLNPSRFEIGAIYSARPKDRKTLRPGVLQPIKRELVFDIDMTDYDEIRTCCSDKAMCRRCWGFIACATEVLDKGLREQFGFESLLWVYSGRRGIHCWISDASAIDLTDDQRKAIITYLEVVKGGKEMTKKVNVRWGKTAILHPSIEAAYKDLGGRFPALILDDQECFKSKEQWETLLALIPDQEIVTAMRNAWTRVPHGTSRQRWNQLCETIKATDPKKEQRRFALLETALKEVVLQYTYPRLDADVSKHRNHLLKSPFVVHPGTNRVCVPVDPKAVHDFDPDAVPTVGQLIRELNEAAASAQLVKGEEGTQEEGRREAVDWRQTSLKPFVDMLDRHTLPLMEKVRANKRKATTIDF